MMKALWAVLIVTLAAAVAVPPRTLSASETACPDGFAATTGGVHEADLNGDGATCEAEMELGTTLALVSVDNGPPGDARRCPDDFEPTAFPWGQPPDRNKNAIICLKHVPSERVPVIAIDDQARA